MSSSDRTVVMVAGLAATIEFFADVARDLEGDHHVVTVELPGHGHTAVGGRSVSIARAADDLAGLLDELDLHKVTLVGWSLGATVAYTYLERTGTARVARLVSVEQSPRLTLAADWPHAAFGTLTDEGTEQFVASILADMPAFADALVQASFAAGSHPDEALVDNLIAQARGCDPGAVAALVRDVVSQDWRERMAGIPVPTLLIHGARSQVYPTAVGPWLAAAIPGSRLEVFDDCGHLPFIEASGRFAAVVREFAAG